jgi:hypothetical protein
VLTIGFPIKLSETVILLMSIDIKRLYLFLNVFLSFATLLFKE